MRHHDEKMTSYQKLLYQNDQGVARLTLNRPEKRNALDPELMLELQDAMATSARDQSIRVVLLKGAGKDFCSGMDLAALQKSAEADVLQNLESARALAQLFLSMRRHPRPIVAAVHGRALAGGCGLATAADIILAAHSAQFGYTEVNIGFVPAIVSAILRRSLSEKRAFELITTGEIISSQLAVDQGLVNRVFPDETFTSDVEGYVSKLASKSQSAVMLSKHVLYHIDAMGFEAAIDAGIEVNTIARMTEDCKRGVENFLKR
jgi:methylglutaconyl-CoA hydratase